MGSPQTSDRISARRKRQRRHDRRLVRRCGRAVGGDEDASKPAYLAGQTERDGLIVRVREAPESRRAVDDGVFGAKGVTARVTPEPAVAGDVKSTA